MTSALLGAGVELMLIGMGTVFTFLTLLVFATSAMSSLVGGDAVPTSPPTAAEGPTNEELAVIGAAVAQHRRAQRSSQKS